MTAVNTTFNPLTEKLLYFSTKAKNTKMYSPEIGDMSDAAVLLVTSMETYGFWNGRLQKLTDPHENIIHEVTVDMPEPETRQIEKKWTFTGFVKKIYAAITSKYGQIYANRFA